MDLYLIRHADARSLVDANVPEDADRPLSDLGEAQARTLGSGLQKRGVRFATLLTSPLLRARQTAEGILRQWTLPAPDLRLCEELAPGARRKKLSRFLRSLKADSLGLVGHMPDLGLFGSWLLGSKKFDLDLAKAGVAKIECVDGPRKGRGTLVWLVTPDWVE